MEPLLAPESIDGTFAPTHHPAVVSVELDGEAVLYHQEANTVHVLSVTATIIWRFLDGSNELDGLCGDLAAVFSIDLEQMRGDVLEAVREFGRQGLLQDVAADPDVVADHLLTSTEEIGAADE